MSMMASLLSWHDRSHAVSVKLSQSRGGIKVFRRTKGERERQFVAPQVAVDNNKYMGGVDQLIGGHATCNIMS